jgi:TetR/AcrR family transcriptional regulator, transcriptional repressor for nem operon
MPRERCFDADEVIDHVADLFLAHGYGGTSLAMLCDATGLGKQSLYNAFGDKKALYLKAVECALARVGLLAAEMRQAHRGREAIGRFFDGVVALCASSKPAERSCIVSNGLLESMEDLELRLMLQSKWELTREKLRAEVERGQRDGSIANPAPSAALADLLISVMSGLRVAARADADAARLRSTAALALSLLDQP